MGKLDADKLVWWLLKETAQPKRGKCPVYFQMATVSQFDTI